MSELPSVFSKTGAFQPLPSEQIELLDEARHAAYEKLRKCADDLKAADATLAETIVNIKAANAEVTKHEAFMSATFPKREFHDLWKETFKG